MVSYISFFHAFLVGPVQGGQGQSQRHSSSILPMYQLMWNVLVFSSKKPVPMAPIVQLAATGDTGKPALF